MNKKLLILGALCLHGSVFADGLACANPVTSIEETVMGMTNELRQVCRAGASQEEVVGVVETLFIPQVDVELITKQVLGRQFWHESTSEDRDQLHQLLKRLLARQYASAFDCGYVENQMTFHPLRGDVKRYTKVEASVPIADKKSVLLRYAMRCDDTEWKVYDIVVDGLSIAQTYRSQFNRILHKGGVSSLIAYLDKQLNKDDA
ncbi:MlaC/ttg2D family ABC transporter substrate-binding protein [Candidatus Synchoanobacter obligatus]|uniref:ABC transporter substrate-binding protein n=1 Tax=Candidatus Synchoanobacter obligatus TaxID=2919597 RepID=A0ABT1L573_9GAMM|nr:ABC transporter substrate-binding protein [Candidatus Synchoanobacter obligatus]